MKVNDDKNREDYSVCGTEMEQKCSLPWSPLERNKFSSKQRYVSCSRSVPRRNKRFVRCDLSRSLNFDANVFDSNSENSSFEENKHLSRSAKIMRALSFNSSPSYYGKTKIKKSLNFNLTPSPKRFPPVKKNIRKALSLNFSSPLSVSNKLLDFDKDPSDSANSSFIFGSSESIDENQNETPLRQRAKERETLHYSTPNTNINRKSMGLASFTPLLHNRLKKTTDNIVYITATPNSQSLKYITGSSKYFDNSTTNTSRNLFHEFHEEDDDRPQTPENLIRIIPESMSAIKRSHKKERSSKRSGHCTTQLANSFSDDKDVTENITDFVLTRHTERTDSDRESHSRHVQSCNSQDDMSDTGSLFDYAEELKSEEASNPIETGDKSMKGLSYSNLDATVNLSDSSYSANVSSDKLSPSKRKIPLDVSREYNTSVSCESELQELDTSQEEFKIFTPLKRKRSLISSTTKDCLRFYNLPSGKDENTKEDIAANISTSRCLTPILNFEEHCAQSSANHLAIVTPYNNVTTEESDIQECDSNDRTGRSTPKNMSTVELYLNLDSIKKSHKKTKRGNISRKGFNLVGDDSFGERCGQTSSAEIGNKTHETFDLSEYDGKNLGIDTSSEDNGDVQGSSRIHVADQNAASTSAEGVLQIVTPPNCLKVKNYIRLLRETSIKRSHKKVRDKKKHELTVDSSQLSDDGSIFGDEEESVDTSRRSVQE
ncbi:hypothetical protein WN55_07799 [Dufourea novaeangliae]|uniref:Uncharacterized protein n=1 Tax=Dufourea novaeangliae TaxID=178035 RepID=A0A154P4T2_DUFNO|nr:hypothetical protein WN55_07799 [Dufourea novaeangliae]